MQASRSSSAREGSTRARATTMPPMQREAMPWAVARRERPFWARLRSRTLTMERKTVSKALLADLPAGYIRGQGNHGAGILDVFKMLAGEIGADDLRADVAGGEVHFHAFPTAFPIGVGEEAREDLGVEIALALEIAVEAAMG